MRIACDLGRVLVIDKKPAEHSISILKRLKEKHELFIVSRVDSEQKARAEIFLQENDIYNLIPKNNVYFCFERRDKRFFVDGLKCDIFIDDRPECIFYVSKKVHKILFNPWPDDLVKWEGKLSNFSITNSWPGVECLIDEYVKNNKPEIEYW